MKKSPSEVRGELRRSIKQVEYVLSCLYNNVDPKVESERLNYNIDLPLLSMSPQDLNERRTTLNVALDKAKRE